MDLNRTSGRLPEPQSMARQLAAGRTLIASAMLAAPVITARQMGTDSATAQRVVWLTRMMAVRDGAIGGGGLLAARQGGSAAVPWLLAGAVSDAVDAVVIAAALKQGRLKGIQARLVVPFAAGAAAIGVLSAVRLRRAVS